MVDASAELASSSRRLIAAWAMIVAAVGVVGALKTGIFVLFWAVPLFVVSSVECGVSGVVPVEGKRDYRRLTIMAHLPLLIGLLGGTLAALLGAGAAVAGLAFGLIALVVVGLFALSAIQTRRSPWKPLGPISLSYLAVNAVVGMLLLPFVSGSLTGFMGD